MHCCDSPRDSEVLKLSVVPRAKGVQAEVAGEGTWVFAESQCPCQQRSDSQPHSEGHRVWPRPWEDVTARLWGPWSQGLQLWKEASFAWYGRRQGSSARVLMRWALFPWGGGGVGTYFLLTNLSFGVTWWLEHSQLCAFNLISQNTNSCNVFTLVMIYTNRYKYATQWTSWCLGPTYWSIVSIPVESITYLRGPKQAVILQWSLR